MSEATFLDTILEAKKKDLEAKKRKLSQARLEEELKKTRPIAGPGFFDVLKSGGQAPKIIAEVKRASPSRGVIRENFSLAEINDAYQSSPHVAAISVLTEKDYFKGGDDILAYFAKNNTHNKPLLRKDFIFDPYQVIESKLLGAQAYLLIVSMLDEDRLNELVDLGLKIGIEPLVEVHDAKELETAKKTNARVIGVNCRNLKTFSLDLKIHELLRGLDDKYAKVAESGIEDHEYLDYLSAFSDASLIGSHFMRQTDMKDAIRALTEPSATKPKDGVLS